MRVDPVPRPQRPIRSQEIPQHLNSEGYLEYDLATYKCDAVAAACIRHNRRVHLRPRLADPAKLSPDDPIWEAVVNWVPGREAKRRIRGRYEIAASSTPMHTQWVRRSRRTRREGTARGEEASEVKHVVTMNIALAVARAR